MIIKAGFREILSVQKKYIFEEKLMNEKEYLERVDARIFSLEIEKTVGETFKINRIELQNFRRYEGNLKIDLTGKIKNHLLLH